MLDGMLTALFNFSSGWNTLGILLIVVLILYFVFMIQNIRQRRIKMIIREHKRFTVKNVTLDLLEIAVFLVASIAMFNQIFLDNPNLEDSTRITSQVEYKPLILNTGTGNSSYVTIDSSKTKFGSQTFTFYVSGKRYKVVNDVSVAFGKEPINVNAEKIPYDKRVLAKMDKQYQKAYVAIYTARYKKTWQNGIGLHAGRIATKYYLIRVPDDSFIKQK